MSLMLILLAAAAAPQAAVPPRAAVQKAVEGLDLSTFPNSLRSEAGPKKKTLRQFGRQTFKWEDGALQVTEASGDFARSFRPLRSVKGRMRLCMDEQALKGTYLTSQAIELTPAAGGLYRARVVKDPNCEDYAR
ncbi:MAG TPA: hypothetical protein VF662_09090 [Allosphingosinicella sp.]|jgi:hypothetical protein